MFWILIYCSACWLAMIILFVQKVAEEDPDWPKRWSWMWFGVYAMWALIIAFGPIWVPTAVILYFVGI